MYTYFYRRRAKAGSPAMAPRKASKANVEVSGQGSDNVVDTSPQSVESIKTWSFVSDVLQFELVDYSDDSSDNENDNLTTKYNIVIQSGMRKNRLIKTLEARLATTEEAAKDQASIRNRTSKAGR
jgi:hypothetical protein